MEVSGRVVGEYYCLNDKEDKQIVSLNGEALCADDILKAIDFHKQHFMGGIHYDRYFKA